MRWMVFKVLAICLASNASAHMGDRVFPIIELSDEDLAKIDIDDGSVEDWIEVVGEPTLTAQDFTTRGGYDPSDLDYRIWMAWHDATNRIYIAIEKADDVYIRYLEEAGSPDDNLWFPWYSDSSLHFLVDGDHSGGTTIYGVNSFPDEERPFQDNKESQYFMVAGERLQESGQHIAPMQNGIRYKQDWFYSPPFADGGGGSFGEAPTIAVTEFYVTPFDWLVWNDPNATRISDLSAGKIIGFAMGMIDYDTKSAGDSEVHHMLYHGFGVYTPAEEFADGVLLDVLGQVPDDSAVEQGSWARIKASFGK